MKTCPWCQKSFPFMVFLTECGSDTLIRHSSQAHPREHQCRHCHKNFWIFYHSRIFNKKVWEWIFTEMGGLLLLLLVCTKGFEKSSPVQLGGLGALFFLLLLPPSLAYAKYESADLRQEK